MKSHSSKNHRDSVVAFSCCTALAVMALAANNAFGLNYTNNLQAWYQSSVIKDSPQSEGEALFTWFDSNGRANDMQQTQSSQQPVYHTNVIGGTPAVRFDGVNDSMAAGDVTFLDGKSNVTIFAVIKTSTSSSSEQAIVSKLFNGTAFDLVVTTQGTFRADFVSFNFNANTSTQRVNDGIARVLEASYDGSTINTYINGLLAGTTNQTGVIPNTADRLGLGALVNSAGSSTRFLNGDIAEVLIYTETLSTANRKLVENYLGDRYSIPVPEVSAMPLVLLASVGVFVLRRRMKHVA